MRLLSTKQLSNDEILACLRQKSKKSEDITAAVQDIIQNVRKNGDLALAKLTEKFDGVRLKSIVVSDQEAQQACRTVDAQLVNALKKAKQNIEKVTRAQMRAKEKTVRPAPGVSVWREFRPIERVGLYVPGGKAAYPSTVLMLGVPAAIAGCKKIILCTPPDTRGACNPAVLAAANLCGISEIFKVGGAQAVAAMAYGTKTIPIIDKIFGPGNQYVTEAKKAVSNSIAIDMPAGPSEILIIADADAKPKWIAADCIAQLEHSQDAQAVVLTPSEQLAKSVIRAAKQQLKKSERGEIVKKALARSSVIIVQSLKEACELANAYAPEHLEIITPSPKNLAKKILNAGSIFLGPYSPVALGDYVTGANHTLPTNAAARVYAGLSADSFGKMVYLQKATRQGLKNLAAPTIAIAKQEGLTAHGKAITIRTI